MTEEPKEDEETIKRLVALEEELGPFPPSGFGGGAIPAARRMAAEEKIEKLREMLTKAATHLTYALEVAVSEKLLDKEEAQMEAQFIIDIHTLLADTK